MEDLGDLSIYTLPVTAVTQSKWSGGSGSAIPMQGIGIIHFWMGWGV